MPSYEEHNDNEVPNTFVPGRNILFLTLASIYAYQIEADTVITGVCETDFSGYPEIVEIHLSKHLIKPYVLV